MARDSEFAVRTKGLDALNRGLERIGQAIRSEAENELRAIARDVRDDAAVYAPRLTGRLAASIQYRSIRKGATVGSALPYAPVQEYGSPGMGIRPRRFVDRAIQKNTRAIDEKVADQFDKLARRHGFI